MPGDADHDPGIGDIADVIEVLFHDFVVALLSCSSEGSHVRIDSHLLRLGVLGAHDCINRRFPNWCGLRNLNNELVLKNSTHMAVKVLPVLDSTIVSRDNLIVILVVISIVESFGFFELH